MSLRTSKIESLMKREISRIMNTQLSDPRIRGLVSITQVDISPDGRNAVIYISVIPDKYTSRCLHGLQSASGRIHRDLVKILSMRVVPRLTFKVDQSIKKQAEIDAAIRRGLGEDNSDQSQLPTGETDQPMPDDRELDSQE